MKLSRLLLLGMMLGMLWAAPGCIIGTVYVPAPDPRAKDFVQVTKVDGLTVYLADGRKSAVVKKTGEDIDYHLSVLKSGYYLDQLPEEDRKKAQELARRVQKLMGKYAKVCRQGQQS